MAEAVAEFDPSTLGAEPLDFDPSSLGAEPVEQEFNPESLGAKPVSRDTYGDKSSRFLAGSAEGGLQAIAGAVRVGQTLNPKLASFFNSVATEMGGAPISEFLTELEGASGRAKDEYGVDPKQDDQFLSTLATAAGNLVPTLASGPAAPMTNALMMGEQGLEEAQAAGGTDTQQATAFVGNAAVGVATEYLLGLPALLKSAQKAKIPEKTFKALVKSVTKQMGLSFVREGSQETLEQMAQDVIGGYIAAYDPKEKKIDQKTLLTTLATQGPFALPELALRQVAGDEGKLLKTFLVGGLVGGPLGAVVQLGENVSEAPTPQEIAPKAEMQDLAGKVDQTLTELVQAIPPSDESFLIHQPSNVTPDPSSLEPPSYKNKEATSAARGGWYVLDQDTKDVLQIRLQTILDRNGKLSWADIPTEIQNQIGTSESIAIKKGFEEDAQAAVNALSAPIQTIPAEDIPNIPQGAPEDLQASAQPKIISTGILTEDGPVRGRDWNTAHADIIKANPELALEKNVDQRKGFVVQDAKGEERFVGRKEALEIGKKAGQVDESKIYTPDQGLISEALIEPKPKETNVQQTQETKTPTPEVAAQAIEPYRDAAIAMAKRSGATDLNAEDIFQEVQADLSRKLSEGSVDQSKLGSLVSVAVRNKTRNVLEAEQAQKRGGGLVQSGDIPNEAGETAITQAETTRGPRAENVSGEDIKSIEEAISRLPESQSKVMRAMVENPGISDTELASLTGFTEPNVRQAKARARQVLRDFIRSQGIGENLGPGAANEAEFRKARYLAATDIFNSTKNQTEFEQQMAQEYEDTFTQEELDDAYKVAQFVTENKGTKSVPDVLAQLMGLQKTGEGITSIKNKQIDAERVKRGVPPIMGLARKSNPALWDEMVRKLDEDKQFQANLISRIKNDPTQAVSDLEQLTLLHAEIAAKNDYAEATKELNNAKDEKSRLVLKERRKEFSNTLNELQQVVRFAGSVAGKSLQARKVVVADDYSVGSMLADLQADQKGEELSPEQIELTQQASDNIQRTTSELDARTEELQIKESEKAFDQSIKSMEGKPILDSRIMAIANKIVSRLDQAADKARERIRARAFNFNAGVDPVVIYDLAVIGASKIAHGLRNIAWRASMKSEFGEGIEPHLDEIFAKSDEMLNQLEEEAPEKDREKVKVAVRKTGTKDVLKDTQSKIKARISEGESLTDLRAYVQKMALAMVRGGVNTRDALVEALHPILETFQPGISRREVMDLVSGYGDSRTLDMEKAKVELRDIKGQLQQLAKIEDIQARVPLQKTGPPRRELSDTERRLQKQVNELKKRIGVVVTDPETQLKSTLSSITTGLKNQISDLTHQIETGEKPVPGTPAPTNEQIESLKTIRSRIRETLKEIEGKPEMSQEQKIKAAENAIERTIKDYEERLKTKSYTKKEGEQLSSDKLTSLRAQRDSLKAQLDTLRSADQDLRDTKKFDQIMKLASDLEGKLSRGEVSPKTKAAKIEDELVTQAREKLANLRTQMQAARSATPEAQQTKLNNAIEAVERSIASYDARLKAGEVGVPAKTPGVSSPILERLRAERNAMVKLVGELRKTPLDPTATALKAYKSRLSAQIAEYQDRIARGDFEKKVRPPLDISTDPEAVRILSEKLKWQKEFDEARYKAQIAAESGLEKGFRYTSETLNAAKSSVGSVDLSAFGRQALVDTLSHPINAFKNLITSIQSMNGERLKVEQAKIALRPNAKNGIYQMSGVDFTDLDGPLSKREEQFRSDWANKVPWIRWSSRQYTMFLNLARADAIDRMVASVPAKLTTAELKYAGKTVNTLTGRGDLGKYAGAADLLSLPLWSPRLYVSRLQTLIGRPLWQKDAGRLRKVVAKEYMRAAASGLGILALGILAGADIEWDKSSSDFMKLRFGNLRIDPWGGIQQWMVFLTRILSGEYKTTKGKKFDLNYSGKRPGPYDPTYGDVLTRMFRSKLNPIAAAVWSYKTGRDIQGNPVSALKAAGQATLPLSIFNDDIVPIAKEFGISRTAAVELLSILGIGVQHYDSDQKKH